LKSIALYVWQLSVWIIILPLLVGAINFYKLDKQSRYVFYLVLLATIPQLLTAFISRTVLLDFIYNAYTPMEFLLVYLFIGRSLESSLFKNISMGTVVAFGILVFGFIFYFGMQAKFFNEWVAVANIFYLTWILLFVLESLKNEKKLIDARQPLFWYLSGLILYTPCTVIVFALYYHIDTSRNILIKNLWIIHGVFNITLYLFFTIGLYKTRRQRMTVL
jgi:hypothetical protein